MDPISECRSERVSVPCGQWRAIVPSIATEKAPELQSGSVACVDTICSRNEIAPLIPRPASVPIAAAFFPTEPGHRQVYETQIAPTNDPGATIDGRYTLLVQGVRRKEGEIEVEVRTSDSYTGRIRFGTLRLCEDRIILEDLTFLGVGERYVPGLSTEFMRLPLEVGARWDDGHWIGEVREKARVSTPLGERDAWRVSVIGTHEQAYTAVGSYWITPGIGILSAALSIPGWHVDTKLSSFEPPASKVETKP